jgi:hypothetical protein
MKLKLIRSQIISVLMLGTILSIPSTQYAHKNYQKWQFVDTASTVGIGIAGTTLASYAVYKMYKELNDKKNLHKVGKQVAMFFGLIGTTVATPLFLYWLYTSHDMRRFYRLPDNLAQQEVEKLIKSARQFHESLNEDFSNNRYYDPLKSIGYGGVSSIVEKLSKKIKTLEKRKKQLQSRTTLEAFSNDTITRFIEICQKLKHALECSWRYAKEREIEELRRIRLEMQCNRY